VEIDNPISSTGYLGTFAAAVLEPSAMKKSISTLKLAVKRETVKLLERDHLTGVAGAAPKLTRDLPCPIQTAKVDCG
jgi:hypothetical protein